MIDSLDSEEIEDNLVDLLRRPELLKFAAKHSDTVEFMAKLGAAGVPLDSIRTVVQDLQDDGELLDVLDERREQRRRVQ